MEILRRGSTGCARATKKLWRPTAGRFLHTGNGRAPIHKVVNLLLMIGFAAAWGATVEELTEYEVKAAFLYNFARFVEWPHQAFPFSGAAMTFCVLGEDPYGFDLDDTIEGKAINGRRLIAKRLKRVQDVRSCQVLFISRSEQARIPQILGELKDASILTVSDVETFARLGGMINFFMERNKIRFMINVDAAERAGLKISSRLLKLATVVRDGAKR